MTVPSPGTTAGYVRVASSKGEESSTPPRTLSRARCCSPFSVAATNPPSRAQVTPIGPFCPFKSSACADGSPIGEAMTGLTQIDMPKFAAEMARLQLTMQTGGEPDVARVRSLADDLVRAEGEWRTVLQRMRLSSDFQSREYFKLTQAFAERQGESLESMCLAMRWQADNMRAFADGMPPLSPPPGLNLEKMMMQQQQPGGAAAANPMAQVSAAQAVDSTPFTGREAAFESDVVREEYEGLCRDHAATVKLGEMYGSFDPLGKLAFLDALEAIEGRWDVFFSRFALMGALNPTFKEQTDAFLSSMGMDASTYREVLREAHDIMRKEAEQERGAA